MSNINSSRCGASVAPIDTSLASLIERMALDPALDPQKRRDAGSALRTVAKALGRRLEELPADPRLLRERLQAVSAAQAGVAPARWRNIASLLTFALRYGELPCIAGRSRDPVSSSWLALKDGCDEKAVWTGLSRFARWCTSRGIEPEDITQDIFPVFFRDLDARLLVKNPAITHRVTCRTWNRVATSAPDRFTACAPMPDNRRTYILPWPTFPASLKADFDAYILEKSETGPLRVGKSAPLRPSSIQTRTYQFRQFIAVLVRLGHSPQDLKTLADILEPATVRSGLLEFLKGKEKGNTQQAHGIATVLRSLALWSGADRRILDPLRDYCRKLESKVGLTTKNRQRVGQMDDPKVMEALVRLPIDVFNRKTSHLPPYRRALQVQTALVVEILLMAPLRIGNLAALDLDRHLSRFGKDRCFYITIPSEEVKNSVELRFPVPRETSLLIDIYLRKYRPTLLEERSNALFPGRDGGSKCVRSLSWNITRFLKSELGIVFNAHAFRHLAADSDVIAPPIPI
jgi:integrase